MRNVIIYADDLQRSRETVYMYVYTKLFSSTPIIRRAQVLRLKRKDLSWARVNFRVAYYGIRYSLQRVSYLFTFTDSAAGNRGMKQLASSVIIYTVSIM